MTNRITLLLKRYTAGAAAALVLAIASMPAWASGAALNVLPQTATFTYAMYNDTNGPDGVKHVDERVTITNRGGADYTTAIAIADESPSIVQLTLASSDLRATNTPASPGLDEDYVRHITSTIGALDILFGAAQNAPEPIVIGSQWRSTVHLTLPGSDIATIPLMMTAQSVRGTDVRITGSGAGDGTARGNGHTLKAQIAVDVTADFHAGRIATATVTQTITGHVFIKTISFKNTWTVTP